MDKYLKITDSWLPPEMKAQALRDIGVRFEGGDMVSPRQHVPCNMFGSHTISKADFLYDMHVHCTPTVEAAANRIVYPMYTYVRWSEPGAELVDLQHRQGVDWTLWVRLSGDRPWPLQVRKNNWTKMYGASDEYAVLTHNHRALFNLSPYTGEEPDVTALLHYTEDRRRVHDAKLPDSPPHVLAPSTLTKADIDRLYASIDDKGWQDAVVGADSSSRRDERMRNNQIRWLYASEFSWLHDKLYKRAQKVNDAAFGVDIGGKSEAIQLTRYVTGQFYDFHVDCMPESPGVAGLRSLSCVVALRNPEKGGGLIVERSGPNPVPMNPGDAIFFLADERHKAVPVEVGVRDSLVIWFGRMTPDQRKGEDDGASSGTDTT